MKNTLNCNIVIGLAILFLLILWNIYNGTFREKTEEEKAVDYIMDNISEFEDDFADMGYEVKLAYTEGDLIDDSETEPDGSSEKTKLGFRGDGILILHKNNQEFHFDIGFDYYKLQLEHEDFLHLSKCKSGDILTLNTGGSKTYPVNVCLMKSKENGDFRFIMHNNYDINFIVFGKDFMGKETRADRCIKEYYSAEELRSIYEDCIALQDKLVELYKEHIGQKAY